ncbi:MAG: IgGFc-binding protein, partial [Lentimicrobiaceae bacterium]|nr:IgGFc-binding protein [Lentimicrobiaceae bacterium]
MKKVYCFFITITLIFSTLSPLQAQTIEGKEFWITFGQIGNVPSSLPILSLQIRIVSGNKATTGNIHFTHLGTDTTFSLGANETYTYPLTLLQREAVYNTSTGITDYSMRITSFDPIVVYTIIFYGVGFGDATNILPATTLDKEYCQISYPPPNTSFPQTYAVVSTQNNTHLFDDGGSEIILNKGEVYYKTNANDMTGAHITANYPVAFFSSHKTAAIPIGVAAGGGYLQQQLAPVSNWGKHFFVPASPTTRDIVRIVVLQNNTNISQTGGTIRTDDPGAQNHLSGLSAGQFVDLEVSNNGCHINATKPIGVCSFLATYTSITSAPSQCWIPAIEQTIPNAIIAPFMPVTGTQLNQHYALVVTPTLTKTNTTVSVGGASAIPLFGGGWIDNAESNMSVYTMPLTHNTASYNFTNPAGLIILCYGSGISVSYYYSAGFAMRNLSAAFTANNIPYDELHSHPFCEHDITFVANIEGIHPNAGSLNWYINGVHQTALTDLHTWNQNFATGNY